MTSKKIAGWTPKPSTPGKKGSTIPPIGAQPGVTNAGKKPPIPLNTKTSAPPIVPATFAADNPTGTAPGTTGAVPTKGVLLSQDAATMIAYWNQGIMDANANMRAAQATFDANPTLYSQRWVDATNAPILSNKLVMQQRVRDLGGVPVS